MTCIGAALLISWGLVWATVGTQEPKVNPEALVLQDFKQRIDKYMELHKQLEKDAPPLKKTDDPAKIKASQDALATGIRAARAGAKQGDIFTPEIAQRFKSLMYPELKGQKGVATKEVDQGRRTAADGPQGQHALPGERRRCRPFLPTCSRTCHSCPRISSTGLSATRSSFATCTRTW